MAKYYNPATKQVEEWGTNPEQLNPQGITGKTLVPETTALGGGYTPITSEALEPISGLPYVNPNQNMFPTFPTAPETPPEPVLGKTEKSIHDMIAELTATTGLAGEKEAFRIEQEKAAGLETMKKTEADYTYQWKQLEAEFKNLQIESQKVESQMQLQAEGRGITAGGLAPFTASEQRKITLKSLDVSSKANTVAALLLGTQGLIDSAQKAVDRAVSQKYAVAEAERKAKLENLQLLLQDPALTAEQKARAEATAARLKAEEKADEKKKTDMNTIAKWAVELASNPAVAQQLMKMAQEEDPNLEEAFALYTQNQPTPKPDLLSVAEAKALGVPYGTTSEQATKMGITPAGKVGETEIEKPLTLWEIDTFKRTYDWTPPYGFTQSQLNQFIKDNPNASPAQLEAGAKQALAQQQGTTAPATEKNTVEGVKERIKNAKDNGYTDDEIKTAIKKIYTTDELFTLAKSAGYAKWYTGKGSDIERMLNEFLK